MTSLPLVPFAILPKKQWEDGQEKRPRVDPKKLKFQADENPEVDNEDEEDGFSYSSSSSYSSYSSSDESDDIPLAEYIDSLIPKTPPDGSAKPKGVWEQDEKKMVVKKRKVGFFSYYWDKFMKWRDEERARRMHNIYKEYEKRVAIYDTKVRKEILHEIRENERVLMEEVKEIEKRIRANSFKRETKKFVNEEMDLEFSRRDKDTERLDFLVCNLQRWAVERHGEEEILAAQWEAEREEREKKIQLEKVKIEREKRIIEDELVVQEDYRITQEAMRMMRVTGAKEGVNVPGGEDAVQALQVDTTFNSKKKKKKGKTEANSPKKKRGGKGRALSRAQENKMALDSGFLKLNLLENVDYKSRVKMLGRDYVTPFDQDLARDKTNQVVCLKARSIGERGALCLGAEFVRGACPQLQLLDLSRCEIKTRGLGRLLHGIRIGNLYNLRSLVLKGNHIGSRGLEYVKDVLTSGVLSELKVLDLRENELGDDGADIIMRMIVGGSFRTLSELYLQNNGITDVGFMKIFKAMQSMQERSFPMIRRLGLELNYISAKCKQECYPIPLYFSL